jgi:uncharacterized protein YcfL
MAVLALAASAHAQQHDPATPWAVANKIDLRGDAASIAVREMRIVRKNDILVVQADLASQGRSDRTVFYRFKWLDSVGNQVGDGESWKQLTVRGLGQQTIKSVAPTGAATDLRLEMNVETR